MGPFGSDAKAAFLLNLWETVKEQTAANSSTLRDAIVSMARGHVQLMDGGAVVSATSQAGQSTTFTVPIEPLRGVTPLTLSALGYEFLRRYDWAAAGGADADDASTDDQTIYDRMQKDMGIQPPGGPVRQYLHDWTYAR